MNPRDQDTRPSPSTSPDVGVRARELATKLEVFLAAYPGVDPSAPVRPLDDDDLLTWGDLLAITKALTTPPDAQRPTLSPQDEERAEAQRVLQQWLDETPRYLGDDPRAEHYQRNVRVLETAIAALAPRLNEGVIEGVKAALRPFASLPMPLEELDDEAVVSGHLSGVEITYRDFRRARRLLTLLEGGGK